jgi:poly-beta-1,6-N-acetyl-D-glucosamine synthase
MAELIFIFSLIFIVYTYIGYPLIIWCVSNLIKKPVQKRLLSEWPIVAVIIAAKNEENKIRKRILNLIQQDYPEDKLQILVVSDGSTDSTANIVRDLAKEKCIHSINLRVIECHPSAGKPTALNKGVELTLGEFIVFADARQTFSKNAIKNLISNFSDSNVGCVSGELVFISNENLDLKIEMGAYWKYEKFIRTMESNSGSVMGATGAIYAIRRSLYSELPQRILLDDVLTPLKILSQGYRVILDNSAQAFDIISENVEQEWNRKVRTLAGNWQLLSYMPSMFNPIQYSWLWRFFSHKIARLLVPFLLVSLLLSSLLAEGILFKLFAIGQIAFYLMALSFVFNTTARQNPVIKLCYFFCVMNIAAFWGFVMWSTGRCDDIW